MLFIDTIIEKLQKNFLGSTVRHVLTGLGGVLLAKGIIDADQASQFVTVNSPIVVGAITYGIGYLLSLSKK